MEFEAISVFVYNMYSEDPFSREIYSHCDRTMLGWYRPSSPQNHSDWGCLYGEKNTISPPVSSTQTQPRWVSPISFLETFLPAYENTEGYAKQLNGLQSSWKAGISDYFKGLSLVEVNRRIGMKRSRKEKPKAEMPIFLQQAANNNSWSQLGLTDTDSLIAFLNTPLDQIPSESLPENWDWTDINGQSFVPFKARNQGNCGSCYALATSEMLESRLYLQSLGRISLRLSTQYLISCGFYTEGCEGGYPILVNRFISEFGVPEEACFPYEARDLACRMECGDAPNRVTVEQYGYIGGYYGAGTAELMQKELRARGPFVVSFEPHRDFSYYTSGVYHSVSNRPAGEDMREADLAWEQVDHSVLLVGWGVEAGLPYWKLQNSWGASWGEGGFFRIRRGVDESGVESMPEFAIPRLLPTVS